MHKRTLIVSILIVGLLSLGTRVVPGDDGCVTQYVFAKLNDGSVSVTGNDQVMWELCFPASPPASSSTASNAVNSTCQIPNGVTITVKDIWYTLLATMGTSEQCKIGLSSDMLGVLPFDFEEWSASDFGDGTTGIASCTESFDPDNQGDLDNVGDSCYMHDPVGMVLNANNSGGNNSVGFRILVDQAESGTPTCTSVGGVKIAMKLKICAVTVK